MTPKRLPSASLVLGVPAVGLAPPTTAGSWRAWTTS